MLEGGAIHSFTTIPPRWRNRSYVSYEETLAVFSLPGEKDIVRFQQDFGQRERIHLWVQAEGTSGCHYWRSKNRSSDQIEDA